MVAAGTEAGAAAGHGAAAVLCTVFNVSDDVKHLHRISDVLCEEGEAGEIERGDFEKREETRGRGRSCRRLESPASLTFGTCSGLPRGFGVVFPITRLVVKSKSSQPFGLALLHTCPEVEFRNKNDSVQPD